VILSDTSDETAAQCVALGWSRLNVTFINEVIYTHTRAQPRAHTEIQTGRHVRTYAHTHIHIHARAQNTL